MSHIYYRTKKMIEAIDRINNETEDTVTYQQVNNDKAIKIMVLL